MKKPMLALALVAASGLAGCSALPEQNLGAVTQRNSTATVFSYDAADNIGWSGSGAPTYINQIEDAIDLFTDGQGAFLAINPAGHVQGWFPNDGSVDSLRVEYGDAIESIDADFANGQSVNIPVEPGKPIFVPKGNRETAVNRSSVRYYELLVELKES